MIAMGGRGTVVVPTCHSPIELFLWRNRENLLAPVYLQLWIAQLLNIVVLATKELTNTVSIL